MSRFPSSTLADRIDDRIQELEDGFVRLGGEDTPFTLREGGESLKKAQRLHCEREEAQRERDEELAAAVFASRIVEPMAAQRIAPGAVRRLEEAFGDLSDKLF